MFGTKKKNQKIFVRKNLHPGIHVICLKKDVRLVDRGAYITSDPKEIEALEADPEIVEFMTDDEIAKVEEKKEKEKQKQLAEQAAKAKEAAENDPGETPPE